MNVPAIMALVDVTNALLVMVVIAIRLIRRDDLSFRVLWVLILSIFVDSKANGGVTALTSIAVVYVLYKTLRKEPI